MNILHVSKKFLWIEFLVLFIILPLILPLNIPLWLKITPVVIGFLYVLFILYKYTKFKIKKPKSSLLKSFWKTTVIRALVVIVFGIIFVQIMSPETFFRIIREEIGLWFMIVFIYSVVSVIPQELIYRNFFWKRYKAIIQNPTLFLFINAFVFSISHTFLKSWAILFATFVGGLMFALTYRKTQSTWLVIIEHSLYGLLLFTIGIGSMLAFPG